MTVDFSGTSDSGFNSEPTSHAFLRKNAHDLIHLYGSVDRGTLSALFKLIEITEPTLLLCRDALKARRNHRRELDTIDLTLSQLRVLKVNLLALPAPAEHADP